MKFWVLLLAPLILLGGMAPFAATPPTAAPVSDPGAAELVRGILDQVPPHGETLRGVLQVRRNNRYQEIPLTWSIEVSSNSWQNVYQTIPTNRQPSERLIIVHRTGAPNEYLYSRPGSPTNAAPQTLTGAQAAVPFAGTDFWLADFGLEFLHWPEQRLDRETKLTMRSGRPCKVLVSINPNPKEGGYVRVRSWIDSEYGGLIFAEAFSATGRRKEFSLDGFKRIDGQVRVKGMKIDDYLTDSKTRVEFDFKTKLPGNP